MSVSSKIPRTLQVGILLSIPACATAVFVFAASELVASTRAPEAHNSELIAQMVKSGASPIEAACAIGRIDHDAPVCIMSLMSATPADGPLPETLAPGGDHPGDPT